MSLVDLLDKTLPRNELFTPLPAPEALGPRASQIFETQKIPLVRNVLSIHKNERSLLHLFDLGAAYLFGLEQGLHQKTPYPTFEQFFAETFVIDRPLTRSIRRYAALPKGLLRPWLVECPNGVSLVAALPIGRGSPPLAPWIRHLLFLFANWQSGSGTFMDKVQGALYAFLQKRDPTLSLPSPEQVVRWLQQAAQGQPLTEPISLDPPERRQNHRNQHPSSGHPYFTAEFWDLLQRGDPLDKDAIQAARQALALIGQLLVDEEEEDTKDADAELEPAPEPPPIPSLKRPVRPPHRFYDLQVDLAIPYPQLADGSKVAEEDLSKGEKLACRLIILADFVITRAESLVDSIHDPSDASPGLIYVMNQALLSYEQQYLRHRDLIDRYAQRSRDALQRQGISEPTTAHGPLPLQYQQTDDGDPPLEWISFDIRHPLREKSSHLIEYRMEALFCSIERLSLEFDLFMERLHQNDPLPSPLALQLFTSLREARLSGVAVAGMYKRRGAIGEEIAKRFYAQRSQKLAALSDNLVILGESQRVPHFVVLGKDEDGRMVADTLHRPTLTLFLGAPNYGKSHVCRLKEEGIVMPTEGLGQFDPALGRIIRFAVDARKGLTDHQLEAGFAPNPSAAERDFLFRHYGVQSGNRAITEAVLLSFDDNLEPLRKKYAHLVERGLRIEPLRGHPAELGHFAYAALLGGAGVGGRFPVWRQLLDSVVGSLGERAMPKRVLAALEKAKIPAVVLERLRARMQTLDALFSEGHYLIDWLALGVPVLISLESAFLAPELMLPMEALLMNTLSRPLRSGENPLRVIVLDELNLQGANAVAALSILEGATLTRHGMAGILASAQRVTALIRQLAPLVTTVAHFYTPSPDGFAAAQKCFGVFRGIPYGEISRLKRGQAFFGSTECTNEAFTRRARKVDLRPSVLHTQGASLTTDLMSQHI